MKEDSTEERNFVGRGVLRAFLRSLMSSAGYHFGARLAASGTRRVPPFFAPPTGFSLCWADILWQEWVVESRLGNAVVVLAIFVVINSSHFILT